MAETNKGACDRSCSVGFGLPCLHQTALADATGLDFTDFMYESQYEDAEFLLPSETEYDDQENLWNANCLVPPYKRKRGRPSTKRKKGFLEKKTQAKTLTYWRCRGKDHTKRWAACPGR